MVAELLFVRGVLDECGIDFLLVRGVAGRHGADRPVLAVDERDRRAAESAIRAACSSEVKFSRLVAARVEFWVYDDVDIHLPRVNILTRTTIRQDEVIRATVDLFGARWPTMEGMWDSHVSDIGFPIDIVFSWVDGADLEWQRARAARMQNHVVGEGDDHEARFRQVDELRYALRSVHMFAPWIRNIYIVTDSPRPAWLAEHPRVFLLPSTNFFADPSTLPTYSSHAVESQLHRIDGLSEHFLYSNDDMFFGRKVSPQAFFTVGGITRFVESNTRIGMGQPALHRSGFENAARVNRALLFQKFGRTITRHLEHCPTPLRRSVLGELEAEFVDDFSRTARSRFRSATDISVTNSLYHFFALLTGRAVPNDTMRVKYVDTTVTSGLAKLASLLRDRDRDFFCLNDGSFPEVSAQFRARAVTSFLEDYFPVRAPWESD
jgi:stealth protein CR2/Stealth-like protein